jgi:acyl-CoA synthetase (AMP-forming)/AMP-acid ligase II
MFDAQREVKLFPKTGGKRMIFTSPYPEVTIPAIPLPDLVLHRAQELGDKPALIEGPTGRTVTYGQLAMDVRRAATGLAQRGFRKGAVCAIYSPNLPEYVVAYHAVASLGGIITTVNPLYTVTELAHQLKDAGAKYVLTVPQFLENARKAAAETGISTIFVFGQSYPDVRGATPFAALLDNDGQAPNVAIDPRADLVTLPYSSGTTGLPKGVMLTHYNLVAEICTLEGVLDAELVTETDTCLAFLPFFHIYGIVAFMSLSMRQGATVVTMPRFDLEQYLEWVQQYQVTVLHLVPPIALALAKHPCVDNYHLASVQRGFSAAAPLSQTVADAVYERLGFRISQAYGMTELSGACHLGPTTSDKIKPSSGGRVMPNCECKVVDLVSGEAVDAGQEGEILVRGPIVMQGYLNQPGATADTIDAEGWLRTGDVGYADADGDFYIVDRTKELIKYKGFQVAPAELEAVLLSHPDISDAAVIPCPDEEAGEIPKAFVVLKAALSPVAIMDFVAERVAPYKKVRQVQIIEQIPKSASGKILRRVLIEQERQQERAV